MEVANRVDFELAFVRPVVLDHRQARDIVPLLDRLRRCGAAVKNRPTVPPSRGEYRAANHARRMMSSQWRDCCGSQTLCLGTGAPERACKHHLLPQDFDATAQDRRTAHPANAC